MGVNMIVKVVQIQRQINVNVVKPGFTTSLRSKYHISPTQSKFKSNTAKPERACFYYAVNIMQIQVRFTDRCKYNGK